MKRLRIGSALAGTTVCAMACALVWPHARDAGAVLVARVDPAELSDIQLNSVRRNNHAVVMENIEAALAANDADRASRFVELARAQNISVDDALLQRVNEAVAHG
jgi:hypothetical protein